MDDPIAYIKEVYDMLKVDGYFAVTMEVDTSNIDNTKRLVAYMQSIFHEPFGIAKVKLDNDSLTPPLISNMYLPTNCFHQISLKFSQNIHHTSRLKHNNLLLVLIFLLLV